MYTSKIFYSSLICLFLFSCGNDEELTANYYENLTKSTGYKDRIESAQCTNIPRPMDTYVYPIVPGTDEWVQLHQKGMEEVLNACRVPEEVLQNQSTQAVIQTFFDYPFSLDMYSSSSTLLDGFIGSVVFNSAYAELLKRKDAGECLLERYLLFNPVGCNVAIIMGPLLEMLLAQQEFYTQLNVDEKKELVKAALGKMDVREDFDPLLANRNETTCMLIGRIMENSGFNPFIEEVKNNKKMSKYLEEQFHGYDNYGLILLYANEFIK